MVKKVNNESNKPKDPSFEASAKKERPHIKPPEIRPRPKMSDERRRELLRPVRRPTGTNQSVRDGSQRPVESTGNARPDGNVHGHNNPPRPLRHFSTEDLHRQSFAGSRPQEPNRAHQPVASGSRQGGRPMPRPSRGGPSELVHSNFGQATKPSPASHNRNEEALRLIPLGGLEEIGRNCSFFEYKNEIIIIDIGLQFPEEETPGIDYIIPNVSYLEKRKENISAIILTHGHYDHIGGLPHVLEKLGNPPIYTTGMTKAIIEKRQEDFPNAPKLHVITVKNGDDVKFSNHFTGHFFGVPHTIPESCGVMLKTPIGNIVHFGDFRIEYDAQGRAQGLEEFAEIGKMGIHTFLCESTNADKPGRSLSEETVEKHLDEIFSAAKGRIIVATFASLLVRVAEIIRIAEKLNRKVALSGYSMKTNIQIAQNLGYLKAKEGTIIPIEDAHRVKDDHLLVLSTGAQGESNASLMKIITGEHRQIKIKPGDTLVLSSSVIPGNESSVQVVKDNLARQGAIIFTSNLVDIHASGHAPKEDLQLAMSLIKPKFLMPVHGYYYQRNVNAQNAIEAGIPRENIRMMDNGQVAELTKDDFKITDETVPAFYVMVDGLGVGDVEEVVLRDRRALAQEGMIVIISTIDRDKGTLIKNPDIISRGFIYLKENQELVDEIRKRVKGLTQRIPNYKEIDPDYLKTLIRDQVGQFVYNKTRRRPMILPVIIEI
jgi:ribonuclease J